MICVSLAARTAAQARAEIAEAAAAGADLVEIRGDWLENPSELAPLVAERLHPLLVTVRSSAEGGRWNGSEEDRLRLLEEACLAGADYVDLEWKRFQEFPRGHARLVLSHHDFDGIPKDLEAIAAAMAERRPDFVKLAICVERTADLLRCVRLQKTLGGRAVVVAMGEVGEPLRILSGRYGGAWTYASLRAGSETAPGQLPVGELVGLYGAKSIDRGTEVYAVLGRPVSHSRGPFLFNPAFRAIGRNARYVRVPWDDSASLRLLYAELELRGASVTIPHKERAAREVDEGTEGFGTVNTVIAEAGGFRGSNTDAPAVVEAVGECAGKSVLLLGAGGAARAAAWGLARAGARITIANRTIERARELADRLGGTVVPWARREEADAEIVVNATSIGMGSDESPMPPTYWRRSMRAVDLVYTPRDTRFLRDARAAGAATVEGTEIFLGQADLQFERFTGQKIPGALLREFRATLQ